MSIQKISTFMQHIQYAGQRDQVQVKTKNAPDTRQDRKKSSMLIIPSKPSLPFVPKRIPALQHCLKNITATLLNL